MDEPETEFQTLERLEAALARIAEHASPKSAAPDDAAARAEIAGALDRVIAQLRDALAEADHAERE